GDMTDAALWHGRCHVRNGIVPQTHEAATLTVVRLKGAGAWHIRLRFGGGRPHVALHRWPVTVGRQGTSAQRSPRRQSEPAAWGGAAPAPPGVGRYSSSAVTRMSTLFRSALETGQFCSPSCAICLKVASSRP